MTNDSNPKLDDSRLDQLLNSAFPGTQTLSSQFEDKVMLEVDAIDRTRLRRRRTSRLMAIYWGLTSAILYGLLAGGTFSAQPAGIAVVAVSLMTFGSGLGLSWLIARQSGISLQNLFARTLL
jgi:hypothetical protein